MPEHTGMTVSQVTDEVLYTGLIEMQELPELVECFYLLKFILTVWHGQWEFRKN